MSVDCNEKKILFLKEKTKIRTPLKGEMMVGCYVKKHSAEKIFLIMHY
jgi:hypothetical protein